MEHRQGIGVGPRLFFIALANIHECWNFFLESKYHRVIFWMIRSKTRHEDRWKSFVPCKVQYMHGALGWYVYDSCTRMMHAYMPDVQTSTSSLSFYHREQNFLSDTKCLMYDNLDRGRRIEVLCHQAFLSALRTIARKGRKVRECACIFFLRKKQMQHKRDACMPIRTRPVHIRFVLRTTHSISLYCFLLHRIELVADPSHDTF